MNDHVKSTQELVPVSHLFLDVDVPIGGWQEALANRGVEIVLDDLGRPSVPRQVLGELIAEHREREALLAEQAAQEAAAQPVAIAAGVPALEGATPFESLAAAAGADYISPAEEFGRPRPRFIEEELEGKP